MTKTFTILCLLAALAISIPCSAADSPDKAVPQVRVTATDAQFNPENQEFTAVGNARVEYGPVILTADEILGNASDGEITATGHVQFQDGDRTLTGDTFEYNYKTETGKGTNTRGESNKVYFRGKEMTAEPKKYDLKGALFTTCDREKPHYYLAAKELIFMPDNMLIAKGVRIVLYGKTLFYFPLYRTPVGNATQQASLKLPTLGAGDHSGVFAGYQFDLGAKSKSPGLLDVRLSTKWFLQGGVKYENVGGSPVFVRATYREPSYGGLEPFSVVSRFPEVGIKIGPKKLTDRYSTSREPMALTRDLIEPLKIQPSSAKVNYVGEIGVGRFAQEPNYYQAWRYDARAMTWLKPVELGNGVLFSPAVSARASKYENGDTYTDLGLRLAAAKKLSDRSFLSVAYIAHSVTGSTPFDFDAVDLRDEFSARAGFPVGPFNMQLMGRFDMNTHELFDTEITVSKPMHCLEPSITWKKRFQEFIFNIGVIGF